MVFPDVTVSVCITCCSRRFPSWTLCAVAPLCTGLAAAQLGGNVPSLEAPLPPSLRQGCPRTCPHAPVPTHLSLCSRQRQQLRICREILAIQRASLWFYLLTVLLKDLTYLFVFREKGREGEREREERPRAVASHVPHHQGPGPQPRHVSLTGNRTSDPLVCRLAFDPLSLTSQGHLLTILICFCCSGHFLYIVAHIR